MSGRKWDNPSHIEELWDAWNNVKPRKKPSSSEDEQTQKQSSDEDETQRQYSSEEEQTPKHTPSRKKSVTPSPSKKHVSPKERYLRQKWLKKHHDTAMKKNLNSKQRSPSPSPPRDVQNLLKKPVEGLGSGKGWENAMKRAKDIERQYKNNKDYGKGYGFGPGDESDDELDDEAEDSDEDYDMEDRSNPFRRGTEEYKAYAEGLRRGRMEKRKGKKINFPAVAMRMRKQEALRKEQQALLRKELARKKRLDEGITNLRISNDLNKRRMNNMKKRLKNIQKGMKKDLKKKKPPKKTKRWYIDESEEETDSQEETETDLQHKNNIKF